MQISRKVEWLVSMFLSLLNVTWGHSHNGNASFQTFAVFWTSYSFFWVNSRRLNFMCRRLGTLCPICIRGVSTSLHHLWRWKRQGVPKRRQVKFRRRRFTQKKENKINITAKQVGFLKKSFYIIRFPMTNFVLSQLLRIKPRIPKFPVIWKPPKNSGRRKGEKEPLPYTGPKILRSTVQNFEARRTWRPWFVHLSVIYAGSGSSVGIAKGYWLDWPGIESRWGRDFPHLPRPALEPTQLPVQ